MYSGHLVIYSFGELHRPIAYRILNVRGFLSIDAAKEIADQLLEWKPAADRCYLMRNNKETRDSFYEANKGNFAEHVVFEEYCKQVGVRLI